MVVESSILNYSAITIVFVFNTIVLIIQMLTGAQTVYNTFASTNALEITIETMLK